MKYLILILIISSTFGCKESQECQDHSMQLDHYIMERVEIQDLPEYQMWNPPQYGLSNNDYQRLVDVENKIHLHNQNLRANKCDAYVDNMGYVTK